MRTALFVFAHQDDELAAAVQIAREIAKGSRASVVYLTNGEGGEARARVRNDESRAALAQLGVEAADIHFIGCDLPIADGRLVEHLEAAFEALLQLHLHPDAVYTLAWEGGHQDHDAANLVAAAFAKRNDVSCTEVPLYHGHRTAGPFFRSMAPLGEGWRTEKISLQEAWRTLLLCRHFPSQRRTWMGLLPEAALRLLFTRRALTRATDASRYAFPPHPGVLFYERRFRYPWASFTGHSRDFVLRHFGVRVP